jgi:hypothetical protein
MENEAPDRRTKSYILRRAIMDCGMGILIFGLGIFFLLAPKFGVNFNIDTSYRYFFAGLCMVYGGWRVYRGYKKKYFV